jgi:SnoaL-like domain
MSQENVEVRALAEAAYGALNAGDLDHFLALTTEDIEFTSLIAEAEGTSFRGRDGVRAWCVRSGPGDHRLRSSPVVRGRPPPLALAPEPERLHLSPNVPHVN